MEEDTYDIIAKYTKTNELMQVKGYGKKEEKVDMWHRTAISAPTPDVSRNLLMRCGTARMGNQLFQL